LLRAGNSWAGYSRRSNSELTPTARTRLWPVDFSSDGQHMLVNWWIHRPHGGHLGIGILNADGSTEDLTQRGKVLGAFSLSPDGSQVAGTQEVGDREAVVVIDVASGSVHTVARLTAREVFSVAWSPDGETIAFIDGTNRTPNQSSDWRIEAVDADGSNRRILHEVSGSFLWADGLRWSPDGTRLCLSLMRTIHDQAIFVMSADGADLTRLTSWRRDWSPTWSPDGSQIAFERGRPSFRSDLMVMNADGSDQHRISWGNFFVLWAPAP